MGCTMPATHRGRKAEATGHGRSRPATPAHNHNPSHCAFQALMKWQTPEGRVGYSEMADIYGLEYLAAARAR